MTCLFIFSYFIKGKVIKAGSILRGKRGKNESTSPERAKAPDTTTEPVNEANRRPVPSNLMSETAKASK